MGNLQLKIEEETFLVNCFTVSPKSTLTLSSHKQMDLTSLRFTFGNLLFPFLIFCSFMTKLEEKFFINNNLMKIKEERIRKIKYTRILVELVSFIFVFFSDFRH